MKILINRSKIFISYFNELKLNFKPGMVAFVLQRITGISLSFFLILHLYTIGSVRNGATALNNAFLKYDNFVGHFMEYLLLLCLLIHALNGMRVIIADFFDFTERHKALLVYCTVILFLIAIPSIWVFLL